MHLVPRVKYWSDTCGYKLAVIAVAHQEFTLFRQHSIPPPSPSTVPFHSVIVGKAKSALSMYIRFNSRTRSICTARRASAAFEWQTVYQECNSLYFAAHAHCDHMAVAWRGQLSRAPPDMPSDGCASWWYFGFFCVMQKPRTHHCAPQAVAGRIAIGV